MIHPDYTRTARVFEPLRETSPRISPAPAQPFFSAVPRDVLALCGAGTLQARDLQVLTLLLDYRSARSAEVWPAQATLAARLSCSVDTIQRSLKKLQRAGLIAIRRLRDAHGRLRQCVYDLARTLALLPRRPQSAAYGADHTASVRPGPVAPAPPSPSDPAADHTAPLRPKANPVLEENNSGPAPAAPPSAPPPPVAADPLLSELLRAGVHAPAALGLLRKHGRDRAAAALKASRRRTVQDRPAFIVAFLSRNWDHPDATAAVPPSSWDLTTEAALRAAQRQHGLPALLAEMRRRHAAAAARRDAHAPRMAARIAQLEAEGAAGTPRNSRIQGSSGEITPPVTSP